MKLNNKGFTLVEVLAVIVILGVLATIMVPAATNMIGDNKEKQYKNLEKTILSSAKVYMSDHRYNITLEGSCNISETRTIRSIKIKENPDVIHEINNQIKIRYLIEDNDLQENIKNPINNKTLDINNSYIYVEYSCKTRDYIYGSCFIDDDKCTDDKKNKLIWK